MNNAIVDVVLRLRDPRDQGALGRSVFSLVCQTYAPLHVHVVTACRPGARIDALQQCIQPLQALGEATRIEILDCEHVHSGDPETALLDAGLQAATGRYLAFLDSGDVLYPEACQKLVTELQRSGCAVAFANIAMKAAVMSHGLVVVKSRQRGITATPWSDAPERDLVPLHRCLIDRGALDGVQTGANGQAGSRPDYGALLRECARRPASVELAGITLGDHYTGSASPS